MVLLMKPIPEKLIDFDFHYSPAASFQQQAASRKRLEIIESNFFPRY
jgi:hypothetical protein